jgi:branched-chain amino acid transport system substrate-binding protein
VARGGVGVAVRRGWRNVRSQNVAVQIVATVVALALVMGVVGLVVVILPSGGSSSSSGGGNEGESTGAKQASTSARGVTKDAITVVFPIIDLSAISNATGLGGTDEKSDQAIETFVGEINDGGGINGRKIDAKIEKFNPYDEADMRAKCKDWTQSSKVFAVVEGIGAWTGLNQLCLTQEHQTPFIGNWTTVTDWTQRGSPYLWWTGADQADVLRNLVTWAVSQGLLAPGKKYGVVAGDRASDKLALDKYLRPALAKAGLPAPQVEQLSASLADAATVQSQAPVAVQRLKTAGVQTIIPLVPFNALQPLLQAQTEQNYFPKLLLSDYESSVSLALGLVEFQFTEALDGQVGPTFETFGNDDHPSGYTPGGLSCYDTWKAHHKIPPDPEAQGPIMSWCQAIRLFAEAAKRAGPSLNRRAFTDAMATITDFQATLTPTLSYGPKRHAGPTQFRVVRIHKNDRSNNMCPGLEDSGRPHGTCWLVVQDYKPLQTG